MKKTISRSILLLCVLAFANACNHLSVPSSPTHGSTSNISTIKHAKDAAGPCPESSYFFPYVAYGQGVSGPTGWATKSLGGSDHTIGGSGCLLTCLAMIAPGRGTNPLQLNNALLAAGPDIYFDDDGGIDPGMVSTNYFKYPCYGLDYLDDDEDINSQVTMYLSENDIVIAHVVSKTGNPSGHYVLITGQGIDEIGNCHFSVLDPGGAFAKTGLLDNYDVIDLRVINAAGVNLIPTITPTPSPTFLPGVPTPTPTSPVST